MKDKKIHIPKRFILRVICNNCGFLAQTSYCWLPEKRLLLSCLSCGEEEIFYTNPEAAENNKEVVLSKEESKLVKEVLNRKDKTINAKN